MATYYSASKQQAIDISAMHPGHLVNALNKLAGSAAEGQPSPEELRLIGEMTVELARKGFELHAMMPR